VDSEKPAESTGSPTSRLPATTGESYPGAGDGRGKISGAELDRWAAVRVGALLSLPESNARSFSVAFALGSILDDRGTTRSLGVGSRSPGTLVTKKRAAHIREVLGISPQRWRALLADWTARYLAHRCSPGVVVLFRQPLLERCPSASCGEFVQGPGRGQRPAIEAPPRGRPFPKSARDASGKALVMQALGAATASASAPQRQAPLSTDPEHHKLRSATKG
jgi:hypothetical protein